MEFEDLLKDVGGFGRYQKILVGIFLIPTYTVVAWFFTGVIFMTATPDHWCHVPEVANSNLSLDVQKRLVRPLSDLSCSTYDVNYSQILRSGNLTVDRDWPTRECIDGWQYDRTFYDATAVTKWNLVCNDAHYSNLAISVMFFGTIIGTQFYGYMADRVGRKPVLFGVIMLIAISEMCSSLSPYFVLFLVLRTIEGSCMISAFNYGYVILIELVDPDVRTWINGVVTMAFSAGLCLLPLVAWLTRNWVYLSMTTASCAAAFCFYWKLLPESPRWLLSEDRYDEAHAILVKISKINGKSAHHGSDLMKKIKVLGEKIKIQRSGTDKHSPLDFFRYPTLRKRFLFIAFCWIITSNTYHGLQVNVKNLTGNEFLNFFLLSLVEVPATLLAWFFMDRVGRRWCLVISYAVSAIACLIPVFFPTDYSQVTVVASLFGKAGINSALMILYQQAPEIFPTSHRCVGMAMTGTVGNGSALLMPYIVYLGIYGTSVPLLIFGFMSLLAAICASFLPETLNKNLPQTVADAENFETDFKYWSWTGTSGVTSNIEETKVLPVKPSMAVSDLQASIRNKLSTNDDPIQSDCL